MKPADVTAAAKDAALIVHAANPPAYRNWAGTVLPMLDSAIAAAKASGARILFPGTIYNYGPDAFPILREDSPQHPKTRKGALRVAMEARLKSSGVRTLIVRAGDFFGPRAGNSWFAQGFVTPGRKVARIVYPGSLRVGHAWAYLPDVAETMARLVDREETLAPFDSFHMRGQWLAPGGEMADAIRAPSDAKCLSGGCRGSRWALCRLSCRCSANCTRCAICGASRCSSTMPSSCLRSATSRARRSTTPSAPR